MFSNQLCPVLFVEPCQFYSAFHTFLGKTIAQVVSAAAPDRGDVLYRCPLMDFRGILGKADIQSQMLLVLDAPVASSTLQDTHGRQFPAHDIAVQLCRLL